MIQLTYISSAIPGTLEIEVEQILIASRRNNAAADITGLLLFDGRRFLQSLEGEASQVYAAYTRIMADPRHRAMVLLSSAEVTKRAFGRWAMAAHLLSSGGGATIGDQIDRLTAEVTDANLREHFRSFARVRVAA